MKRQSRQLLGLLVCMSHCISPQAFAQEQETVNSSPVADSESQFLFINMLEFLGEFETQTGEWVSPDILGNAVFSDLDSAGNQSLEPTSENRVRSEVIEKNTQRVRSSSLEGNR